MSVEAVELVGWVLAGLFVIGPLWRWAMRHADTEHHRHTAAADQRALHELHQREDW